MTDLQCAARVFLAAVGGADQAPQLAAVLANERIARVWTGPQPQALATAESVAQALGVDVVVGQDLDDMLERIADTHRGEGALVVVDSAAVHGVVPALAPGEMIALEGDSTGWLALSRDDRAVDDH